MSVCFFRLQPIGEAHIQGWRTGSLQDPQCRHGEECVWGRVHQYPHLPQQGNTCIHHSVCNRTSSHVYHHLLYSFWHFHPLQQTVLRDLRFGVEPDDGENLRRIGRSLSGTVVTTRRSRLTATRSFVSLPSCALLPPCGCAIKLHLPNVALYTLLLPVLISPAVCFISSCCPAFRSPTCPPTLCLSSFLSKVKHSDVSASPCLLPLFWVLLLFHHYHHPHPPHH